MKNLELKKYIIAEAKKIIKTDMLNEEKSRIIKELKILSEAVNTNLEMKNVFLFIVNNLKKQGLKVSFIYNDQTNDKSTVQKLSHDSNYDVYVTIDSRGESWGNKLTVKFEPRLPKDKVEQYISYLKTNTEKQFGDLLIFDSSTWSSMGNDYTGTTLLVKMNPKFTQNKRPKLDKFMGLKISHDKNGIDWLIGSALYLGRTDKETNMSLIKIDNNAKKVEISKGTGMELSRTKYKDQIINIAKQFAKKMGYQYAPISNDFK